MSDTRFRKDRRDALGLIVGGVVIIPVTTLLSTKAAAASDLPHVAEDDPTARALRYVHDATTAERTDKGGTPGEKQLCSNCNFIRADSGEWRPCQLFPGKAVNENGWCASWFLKST